MKWIIRAAAVVLVGGGLVACSDDRPACAATVPTPALRMQPAAGPTYKPPAPAYKPPAQQKPPAYKAPAQPRKQDTTRQAAPKPQTKVTSWKTYTPAHSWGTTYGHNRPAVPAPTVVWWHDNWYRTYPGYTGYYGPGTFPYGYGENYGCVPAEESDGD